MAKNTICIGCGSGKVWNNGFMVCISSLCLYSIKVNVIRSNVGLRTKPTTHHRNDKPIY